MDEQITQLDKRLTVVEKDVSMLTTQLEREHLHYATKEDIAGIRTEIITSELRLTTQIAAADIKLTKQIADVDVKLSSQIADMDSKFSSQISDVDSKLSAQIADVDRKLSVQVAALESKIFQMESRFIRWTVGTVVTVAGVVLAIVRIFP